jgi:hypothetical protein
MKREYWDQRADGAGLTIADGSVTELSMNHCVVYPVGKVLNAQWLNAKTKPNQMDCVVVTMQRNGDEITQRHNEFEISRLRKKCAQSKNSRWEDLVHRIANSVVVLRMDVEIKKKQESALITITKPEKRADGSVTDATKC